MSATPKYAYRLGARALRRVVPTLSLEEARVLARQLGQAMHDEQINTRRRATMFIAQVAHESGGFHYREEIASGAAYEGRMDLNNWKIGDGRRFKGRTFIQITGRANYAAVSRALGVDFIAQPELLATVQYAAKGAAWWWRTHGCNELADSGDFVAVTKRINGGINGLAERQRYYRRALLVSPFLIPKRRRP